MKKSQSRLYQIWLLMVVAIIIAPCCNPNAVAIAAGVTGAPVFPQSMNITGTFNLGDRITFTVNAALSGDSILYYKFFCRANYGTAAYGNTPWEVMQGYSSNNSCVYTFPQSGSYIVVARVVSDPNSEPVDLPIIGGVVTIGNESGVHISRLSSVAATAGFVNPGVPLTYTVNASSFTGAPLYYKWFYRANYGTSAYDATPWVVVKDYSTSNTCDFTFPNTGKYIVVVRVVTDPNNEPADVPIIGTVAICSTNSVAPISCQTMIPSEQPYAVRHEANPYPTPPDGYGSVIGWVVATIGNGGSIGGVTVHSLELWENDGGVETLLIDKITCPLCDENNKVFGYSLPKSQWQNPSAWAKPNEASKFRVVGSAVVVPVSDLPGHVYHFWHVVWPRSATKRGAKYYLIADAAVDGDAMVQIGLDYWERTDGGRNLEAAVSDWHCASPGMQTIKAGAYR